MRKNGSLRELAGLFLKLGSIAFGGPAAHIAMMEDEVVRKKKWMAHEHFLDLISATNLIPGPNSSEMAMHCGYERAGWKGLFVAGLSFIFPAILITSVLAWLYVQYGQLPRVEPFIYGIKPVVIAIIFSAVISLGRKALKNVWLGFLGILAVVFSLLGVNELTVLIGVGMIGIVSYYLKMKKGIVNVFVPVTFFGILAENGSVDNLKIFWIFFKIGSLLYGSGYVLFAFLDAELVAKGLLDRQELIDAVAVGQLTPGPVLSTATFVGWQLNGFEGALIATIGIFLPSFFLVALLNPVIPKLRKSKVMSGFLDSVNIASVGIILAVCVKIGSDVLVDWRSVVLGIASLIVVFVFKKLNSAFVVLGGAMGGYFLWLL